MRCNPTAETHATKIPECPTCAGTKVQPLYVMSSGVRVVCQDSFHTALSEHFPLHCPTCGNSAGCPAFELRGDRQVYCADSFHGDLSDGPVLDYMDKLLNGRRA